MFLPTHVETSFTTAVNVTVDSVVEAIVDPAVHFFIQATVDSEVEVTGSQPSSSAPFHSSSS